MKYRGIKREEELKRKVGKDWFSAFDDTRILGNIDFCVSPKKQSNKDDFESLLWAEAKTKDYDTIAMVSQLIFTIGKERTFDTHLPPAYLGAFDFKKIVFIPFNEVTDIFYMNDFNWNVAPSNHETKEFCLIKSRVESIVNKNKYLFDFIDDAYELKHFIKHNLVTGSSQVKILIDKNNFVPIYLRWLSQVKPLIDFNWIEGKRKSILDSDFFLADLFVDDKGTTSAEDDTPIKDELFIIFKNGRYEISKENLKSLFNATIEITDKLKYENFWKKYRREPLLEFQQYIIDRRDLLIPQDIRERKGAFFTPQIWVELSQRYLAEVLGEEWQNEFYVWDCAAGTGNLLVGLTNKYNVWASTIDQADVNVMHERIKNGANLVPNHVFQFDFLNDDFSKLPKNLQQVIIDPEKRKKLVIYINPPYAEASSYGTESIAQVANNTAIFLKYKDIIGAESLNELFAQFFTRIINELPTVILAAFSTPKYITSDKFNRFRRNFHARYLKGFICRSDTFDNVSGKFPIGFMIWNLAQKFPVNAVNTDVYDSDKLLSAQIYKGVKTFEITQNKSMGEWRATFYTPVKSPIAYMIIVGPSMQSNNNTFFTNKPAESYIKKGMVANIESVNLLDMCVYLSIRHCIETTWINNKDVFLAPQTNYLQDEYFMSDSLAFALFCNFNNVTSFGAVNHWIPFTEEEVDSRAKFESSFMTDFINGKEQPSSTNDLFNRQTRNRTTSLEFSQEAKSVFEAGKALWRYYHSFKAINVNASLYDIREHFQGRNEKGKMNSKSEDLVYMQLITELRSQLKILSDNIAPKVYDYGFLKP